MKSCVALPLAALLVLLTLSGIAEVAQAQGLPGLLALQMKGYMSYGASSLSSSGIEVTYFTTEEVCFDAGGVPASDANTLLSNEVAYWMTVNGGGKDSTIYTGSSAAPSLPGTNCAELVPGATVPNSDNCYYRWRYGFYDMYSYNGEPGTAYWIGLYRRKTGPSQILNQFQQFTWNPDHPADKPYPRGYFGGAASYDTVTNGLLRMDAPLLPRNNDPYPTGKYMMVCEYQLYPVRPPFTTRMPQPQFVNGFKTLTWAQSHWWLIFLIVAVIVLVILFVIVIYCSCTSIKPKEELPVFQMVIRERVGKAYVVSDEPPKMTQQPYAAPGLAPQQHMLSPEQEVQRRRMRYGRGFNPNQPGDPEDTTMGATGIYSVGERRQYADGILSENSVDNLIQRKFDMGESTLSPEGPQSGTEEQNDKEGTYQEPSAVLLTRRSSRRSRGRSISQAFSDVEMPQAGEINENDVNL
ncbi:hypothetical protein conserved [Leishmania donovani]|uniref:Hypothetical_protein_conserved n=1 Tax=Leishmania donovani TaxID=5661 RepID=A0A504XNU5_LEIDO|nr:hypothetical protein CGC20_17005 [Leishmania donovani]CAJ1987224.1 hypothetical protein conserved [Leishmania donovani]VDZ43113.1 hypothetical_protein_conserved [Leishmania donovani]